MTHTTHSSAAAVKFVRWLIMPAFAVVLLWPEPAAAQVRRRRQPFFNGGATAFEPEIGVVNSGIIGDVQAVVSHDRKYVTLNMRPSNAELLALREFAFAQRPAVRGQGFVGGAAAGRAGGRVPSILDRPGMTRLSAAGDGE